MQGHESMDVLLFHFIQLEGIYLSWEHNKPDSNCWIIKPRHRQVDTFCAMMSQ